MNRLDFSIRRLTAQREYLKLASKIIEGRDGPVLEIGLGKGRTYDYLRDLLSDREIFAFDRNISAYPDCTPDADHIFLGDFRETLMIAEDRIGGTAIMAHCDFGSEDREQDAILAKWLGPVINRLMAPDGVIASDRKMYVDEWHSIELASNIEDDMYFLYRTPKEL